MEKICKDREDDCMQKRDKQENISKKEEIVSKLEKNNIPILTLDHKWHRLFSGKKKSQKISNLEDKLNQIIKSQGKINTEKAELVKLKKTLMSGIVQNMDVENSPRVDKKMQKSRELIDDINDKLILLEDKELDIPRETVATNAKLAFYTMEEFYDIYNKNQQDIEKLQEWIEKTRIELKKRVLLLQKKKEENKQYDAYFSEIIDQEIMNDYREYREYKDMQE